MPVRFAEAQDRAGTSGPSPASMAPEAEPAAPVARVLAVGEYLVGDAEDTLLNGHPDIRY
ncbi:hypothetical protein [Hymenobacter chitinivorans]|uniref:hypothetical protein n=1 Tax=Hymenobacter chitinivorans TaxID=89969 RepID=UPI0012FD6F1C|nr:hypothetical protein [Hymenobacter chitinivorans]